MVLQGKLEDGLYKLHIPETKNRKKTAAHSFVNPPINPEIRLNSVELKRRVDPQYFVSSGLSLDVLHRRLGHPSSQVMSHVQNSCNFDVSINGKLSFCDACQLGKIHALPYNSSSSQTLSPLELIHTNIWGPAPTVSNSGYKYYIHFIDDFSRYTWIYPLRTRAEALSSFIIFKNQIEKTLDTKIKKLQSDWGGEYRPFENYLRNNGITFQHSCPHAHEHNGKAERKHRHIVEMGLNLLAQASMPSIFWWEAFQTSVYLINRLPAPVLKLLSPLEKLNKRKPDYSFLKTFGCSCFPYLRPFQSTKFQFHTTKCVFFRIQQLSQRVPMSSS